MAPDIPVFKIQSDLLPRFRNTPFNYFQSFYPITKRNEKLLSPSSKTPIRTINRDESTRSKRERQLFHTKTRSYRDQAYLTNKNKEEEEKKKRIRNARSPRLVPCCSFGQLTSPVPPSTSTRSNWHSSRSTWFVGWSTSILKAWSSLPRRKVRHFRLRFHSFVTGTTVSKKYNVDTSWYVYTRQFRFVEREREKRKEKKSEEGDEESIESRSTLPTASSFLFFFFSTRPI